MARALYRDPLNRHTDRHNWKHYLPIITSLSSSKNPANIRIPTTTNTLFYTKFNYRWPTQSQLIHWKRGCRGFAERSDVILLHFSNMYTNFIVVPPRVSFSKLKFSRQMGTFLISEKAFKHFEQSTIQINNYYAPARTLFLLIECSTMCGYLFCIMR